MKSINEKLSEVVSKEFSKSVEAQKNKDFEQLLKDMKKTGLIPKPHYNLPLVDTIGKTYYSLNKRK